MRGNLVVIPVENVAWDGSGYTFDMQFRLGRLAGDLTVAGSVGADGSITGEFAGSGMVPFQAFEGTLASGEN
jgi:hypothetical protein